MVDRLLPWIILPLILCGLIAVSVLAHTWEARSPQAQQQVLAPNPDERQRREDRENNIIAICKKKITPTPDEAIEMIACISRNMGR